MTQAAAESRAGLEGVVAQFVRDGFTVARGLFSREEAGEVREAFMLQAQDGPVPGLSDVKPAAGGSAGAAAHDPADPLSFYPRMMHPHLHPQLPVGPLARRYLLDSRLRPILAALLEDEPVAVQSMFYFKPPGARGQALHQDNFYLRVRPGTCVAAWLAVDDADEENGGMVVVPGTKDLEIVCPEAADPTQFFTSEHVEPPPGLSPVPVNLRAGDVLFFNGSLIHGSYPNSSADRFRRSLIFHYAPSSAQELARWYREPTTFDGRVLSIPGAQDGGPCGTVQPTGPH